MKIYIKSNTLLFSYGALLLLSLFGIYQPAYAFVTELGEPHALTPTSRFSEEKAGPSPFLITLFPQKTKIMTGEKIDVSVNLEWQTGIKITGLIYPQPFGDWVVVSRKLGKSFYNTRTGRWERKDFLTLMTYLDGKVDIPALKAHVIEPNQLPLEYQSSVLTLDVSPKVNKKGELELILKDIKSPIWMISIWQILLAVLIALVLLAAFAWYSHKAGLLGTGLKAVPLRPPEEIAWEKLEVLKNSDFLSQGNFKSYYIELTDILRHYLEGRYSISAPDRTTTELMKELKNILERKDIYSLRDLLERSDYIKFAKGSPDSKEIALDWNMVKDFVDKTTQIYLDSQKSILKSESNENPNVTIFTTKGRKL